MYQHTPQLFRNLIRNEERQSNVGLVTVTAAPVTLLTFSAIDLSVGNFVLFTYIARILKGGVSGSTTVRLVFSAGTAVLTYAGIDLSGRDLSLSAPRHQAATNWDVSLMGLLKVTTAGTATLLIEGYSTNSDSTIAADNGNGELITLF